MRIGTIIAILILAASLSLAREKGGEGGTTHPGILLSFQLCKINFLIGEAKVLDGWLQPLAGFVRADGDMDTDRSYSTCRGKTQTL